MLQGMPFCKLLLRARPQREASGAEPSKRQRVLPSCVVVVALPLMKMQQVATAPQAAVMRGSQVRAPTLERTRLEGTWNSTYPA